MAQETTDTSTLRRTIEPRYYMTLWRWHFYAGLLVVPLLLTLTITGALYIFQRDIIEWVHPMAVQPSGPRIPLSQQVAAAEKSKPGFKVFSLSIDRFDRSTDLFLKREAKASESAHVYVDPSSGRVLGEGGWLASFFDQDLKLHMNLFAGQFGSVLVELASSWTLILVVTGCYLWWPRGRKFWGVWLPRFNRGVRLLLRDLHAVPGFYLAIGGGLIAFTGLFFSPVWNSAYRWFDAGYPRGFEHPPQSVITAGAVGPDVDPVYEAAMAHGFRPQIFVAFPQGPRDSWEVVSFANQPPFQVGALWVDRYTGKILDLYAPSASSPLTNLRWIAYLIHTGAIFGTTTKTIALAVCLGIVLLIITGVWMWWRRRPAGKIGLPQRHPVPAPLVVAAALFGLFLPVAGASMVVVWPVTSLVRRVLRRRPIVGFNQAKPSGRRPAG